MPQRHATVRRQLTQSQLSLPLQAARANALTAEQGLADRVSFQVADALRMPFSDGVASMQLCLNRIHSHIRRADALPTVLRSRSNGAPHICSVGLYRLLIANELPKSQASSTWRGRWRAGSTCRTSSASSTSWCAWSPPEAASSSSPGAAFHAAQLPPADSVRL